MGEARHPLMVGASVVFVIAAAYLVTEVQRNAGSSLAALSLAQAEELRQLSLKKEAEFESQRLNKAVIDDGDLALLGEAVQAQQDYLTSRGALASENVRLETMRRRYHVIQAERQRSISTEAEGKATAIAKSDPAGAIVELRRAVEAERLIESRWFFSGYADVGKIARLDTRLRRLEAEPLRAQTQALEAQAEVAFTAGRLDEAVKGMGRPLKPSRPLSESIGTYWIRNLPGSSAYLSGRKRCARILYTCRQSPRRQRPPKRLKAMRRQYLERPKKRRQPSRCKRLSGRC